MVSTLKTSDFVLAAAARAVHDRPVQAAEALGTNLGPGELPMRQLDAPLIESVEQNLYFALSCAGAARKKMGSADHWTTAYIAAASEYARAIKDAEKWRGRLRDLSVDPDDVLADLLQLEGL